MNLQEAIKLQAEAGMEHAADSVPAAFFFRGACDVDQAGRALPRRSPSLRSASWSEA